MRVTNQSLRGAYEMIRAHYAAGGLEPERLGSVGYAGGWTTVSGTKAQGGMAFHFSGEHAVHGSVDPSQLTGLQRFVGERLFDLVDDLFERSGLLFRSVLVAALNALSHPLTAPRALAARGFSPDSDESLGFLRDGDLVVVVGYGRVLSALRERGISFHACELRPLSNLRSLYVGEQIRWSAGDVTFHIGEEAGNDVLARADAVFITASTLVNDSLNRLLNSCRNARIRGLFGPTAGLVPEYLFGLGLNYLLYDRSLDPAGLSRDLFEKNERRAWSDKFAPLVLRAFSDEPAG